MNILEKFKEAGEREKKEYKKYLTLLRRFEKKIIPWIKEHPRFGEFIQRPDEFQNIELHGISEFNFKTCMEFEIYFKSHKTWSLIPAKEINKFFGSYPNLNRTLKTILKHSKTIDEINNYILTSWIQLDVSEEWVIDFVYEHLTKSSKDILRDKEEFKEKLYKVNVFLFDFEKCKITLGAWLTNGKYQPIHLRTKSIKVSELEKKAQTLMCKDNNNN